ncbi:MAG: Pseudogene of conserved hypothetical protein [Methanobrevibacter sp. CfCl-M3]
MAAKKGKTQNTIINDLINKGLDAGKDEGRIKTRVINNELPKPKINDKSKSLKEMDGFIKLDEPVNIEKLINDIHYRV